MDGRKESMCPVSGLNAVNRLRKKSYQWLITGYRVVQLDLKNWALILIGWFQMEILGYDWFVPNGNTGL